MKKLLIIGAGGFGREVLEYARDMEDAGAANWEIGGFLDDNRNALDHYACKYKIIDTVFGHKISDEFVYICAVGDSETKLEIGKRFLKEGADFINIIHPTARVGRSCKIGIGVVLCPNSILSADVSLGNFTAINMNSICSHDVTVGDGSTVSSACDLTGFVSLGEGVFLGSSASVTPGVKIGDYARIGAGAAVTRDIPARCTAVGVPARIIK